MAILKIARMGHPVLQRRAEPVDDPTSPDIHGLISDMLETMADANGTGLAAPQVHVPLRVIVFFVSEHRATDDPDDGPVPLTALINPEIEVIGDEVQSGWEGCLSLPGLTGEVERPNRIRYRGYTPGGDLLEREASGFHARVVQHEFDHLEGVLYPMRMTDAARFGFAEEIGRVRAAEMRAEAEAREEAEAAASAG